MTILSHGIHLEYPVQWILLVDWTFGFWISSDSFGFGDKVGRCLGRGAFLVSQAQFSDGHGREADEACSTLSATPTYTLPFSLLEEAVDVLYKHNPVQGVCSKNGFQ